MKQTSYSKLAEKLGYPESKNIYKILEVLMTPDEAQLVGLLPTLEEVKQSADPANELGKRLGTAEEEAAKRLQDLYRRGILHRYKGSYIFNSKVIELFEEVLWNLHQEPGQDLKDAWKEFAESGWYHDRAEFKVNLKPPKQRIIPYAKALANPDELLPYENMTEILKVVEKFALVACACRRMKRACDKPVNVCVQFDERAQTLVIDRGSGDAISYSQALQVVENAEEAGLIHMVDNHRFETGLKRVALCNCCTCCCIAFVGAKEMGRLHDAIAKSRYEARVDHLLCNGCQICVDRCQFDAIEMVKSKDSKKLKAFVKKEDCFGCGACAIKCPEGALTLVVARPPEHIPATGVSEATCYM